MTDFGSHLAAVAMSDSGTDALVVNPELKAGLRRLRGYVRVAREDADVLIGRLPDENRDAIAHGLVEVEEELTALIGDGEDGA